MPNGLIKKKKKRVQQAGLRTIETLREDIAKKQKEPLSRGSVVNNKGDFLGSEWFYILARLLVRDLGE